MGYTREYSAVAPARSELDGWTGVSVIEFGTAWCGHCMAAQPAIEAALGAHAEVRHLKIEDGPGRVLGRSFRVKLWPTLVVLRDGVEVARSVRPTRAKDIEDALRASIG
jgi:thioredoxin 1